MMERRFIDGKFPNVDGNEVSPLETIVAEVRKLRFPNESGSDLMGSDERVSEFKFKLPNELGKAVIGELTMNKLLSNLQLLMESGNVVKEVVSRVK
jgi:hypothetical protein